MAHTGGIEVKCRGLRAPGANADTNLADIARLGTHAGHAVDILTVAPALAEGNFAGFVGANVGAKAIGYHFIGAIAAQGHTRLARVGGQLAIACYAKGGGAIAVAARIARVQGGLVLAVFAHAAFGTFADDRDTSASATDRYAVSRGATARETVAFCNEVRERETKRVPEQWVEWGGVRK
jgi:hypothetical protein